LCLVAKPLVAETPTKKDIVSAVIVSKRENRSHPELIAKLNCCENRCKWDENKIVDSNGKYSYGGLQYQRDTFLGYGHESGVLPTWIDKTNFKEFIYDKDVQTLIAEYMITIGIADSYGGWFNCFRNPKYNLSQYL
jgi:hypothetical protein